MKHILSLFLLCLCLTGQSAVITNWGTQLPNGSPNSTDVILMQQGGVTRYFTPSQLATNISTNAALSTIISNIVNSTISVSTSAVTAGRIILVDSVNGNDATAARGYLGSPYATPTNAAAVMQNGDTLQVRGGAYSLSSRQSAGSNPGPALGFTNLSNIRIVGEPSTVWYMSGLKSNNLSYACPGLWFQNCTNVVIEGITLIGLRTNAPVQSHSAVVLNTCDGVTFRNCTFSNWQNHAVVAMSDVNVNRRLSYYDNTFADIGGTNHIDLGQDGVAIGCEATNVVVLGNRFFYNNRDVEFCCNSDTRQVLIGDNITVGCYGQSFLLISTNSSDVKIVNNIAIGYATNAIGGGATWLNVWAGSNVTIQGNQVAGYWTAVDHTGALGHRTVDWDILDNVFQECSYVGINMQVPIGNTHVLDRIRIMRNTVRACANQGITFNGHNSRVEQNTLIDCNTNAGVGGYIRIGFSGYATNNTNTTIVGNRLIGASAQPGIVIDTGSSSNVVWGNEIDRRITGGTAGLTDNGTGTRGITHRFSINMAASNAVDVGTWAKPVQTNWVNDLVANESISLVAYPGQTGFDLLHIGTNATTGLFTRSNGAVLIKNIAGESFTIETTEDVNGSTINQYYNHAAPAAGQRISEWHAYANNSAGTKVQQAAMYAEQKDPTAGIESGDLKFNVTSDNELLVYLEFNGDTRTTLINPGNLFGNSTNQSLRVSGARSTNALFVSGTTGFVGVNHGSPGYRFTVRGTNTSNQSDATAKFYSGSTDAATKAIWLGYNLANNTGLIGAVTDGASHDQLVLNSQGGNVGIGIATSTVGSKLTVNGGVSIGSAYIATASPTDGLIVVGNAGFGTASPASSLDATGQVRGASAIFTNSVTVTGTTNQLIFGNTNPAPASAASPTKWISVQITGDATLYRLPLYQ